MINLNLKNRFLSFNLVSLIFLLSRSGKIKKQANSKKKNLFCNGVDRRDNCPPKVETFISLSSFKVREAGRGG